VTVGTTPTLIVSGRAGDNYSGASVVVRPAATVFLGGPDVTTGVGYSVVAGGEMAVDLGDGDDLYAVVASGTTTVDVLRLGVT
jgi:hypothetical protein